MRTVPAYSAACVVAVLLAVGMLGASGCSSRGVVWELRKYEDAQELGRKSGKLTFVYFRSWYLVECTNFEEQVLKTPEVLLQTRGMICVPLDFNWDRSLAGEWGLTQVPAFALVSPAGDVLVRKQAPITRAELLAAFREAKAQMTPTTSPAPATATNP